jgi:hypothetical protein
MDCNCSKYQPIELSRKSVNKRIRQTKEIMLQLDVLAEDKGEDSYLKLLRCRVCAQFWQNGREWNFAYKEYLFQVPETEVADWLEEPYVQPAALMLYSAMMHNYFEQNKFEEGSSKCRKESCESKAIKSGAFCLQHHIESLQDVRLLPKLPLGKIFPPYSLKQNESK